MNYLQNRVELGSFWENIPQVLTRGLDMFMNYQTTKSQSEQNRLAMQLQYEVEVARIEAQKEAAAIAAEAERTRWQAMMESLKVKTAAVDWATVAKIGLPIVGIGIGIWLIVRKRK